jgi:hypothetical protein
MIATAAAVALAFAASGPSHATAQHYAHRTYIVQFGHRRHFDVVGRRHSFRAADGSRITAFAMLLSDSGDGSGQAVELFRGKRFLGWASAYDAIHVRVSARGRSIAVRYGVYRGNDPFCCPSAIRVVHYRWNGSRIVADGVPPLEYGRHGNRLHLERKGHHRRSARVVSCHRPVSATQTITSARAMSCRAAARDLHRTRKPVGRRFRTHGGFTCRRVSGGELGGEWRCVRGKRAYRFEFGD